MTSTLGAPEPNKIRDSYSYFVRPLLVKNQNWDFPFSAAGTGFIVGINDERILITAQHVVFQGVCVNYTRLANLTTIKENDGSSGELLHFTDNFSINMTINGEIQPASDISFHRIQKDQAETIVNYFPIINGCDRYKVGPCTHGDQILIYGYPLSPDRQIMDYDTRVLNAKAIGIRAIFNQWDGLQNQIGIAGFIECYEVGSHAPYTGTLDGFSGSPVFIKNANGAYFAGMLISAGGGLLRFISSNIIVAAALDISFSPEEY